MLSDAYRVLRSSLLQRTCIYAAGFARHFGALYQPQSNMKQRCLFDTGLGGPARAESPIARLYLTVGVYDINLPCVLVRADYDLLSVGATE